MVSVSAIGPAMRPKKISAVAREEHRVGRRIHARERHCGVGGDEIPDGVEDQARPAGPSVL